MKQTALITGATGGLGLAYTNECAKRGYNLVLSATKQERLDALKEKLAVEYPEIEIFTKAADLTKKESRDELFKFIDDKKIELNILINNAGFLFEGSFCGTPREEVLSGVNVNVVGTTDITYNFLARRNTEKQSYIIFVSSMAGFYPMPQMATYAATKAYLTSLAQALREELKGKNCYVTAVCPGSLATTDAMKASIKSQGFSGKLSLQDTKKVARVSLNKVHKNKAIYIPGGFNHFMHFGSVVINHRLLAKFIKKRWTKCEKKRGTYR